MLGTAVSGLSRPIFFKNVNREMGQICNISFWPLFTIKLGKMPKIVRFAVANEPTAKLVYILLSAERRAYFCKRIAIEIGGVSRYFSSKVSGSGVDVTLLIFRERVNREVQTVN